MGLENASNKGIWYKGYLFPLIKLKYSATSQSYKLDRPTFNNPNYINYFLPFARKYDSFSSNEDAQIKFLNWFAREAPDSSSVEDTDKTIKNILKDHNLIEDFKQLHRTEYKRISALHPKKAFGATKDMGTYTSASKYSQALTTALSRVAEEAEEGKAVAEEGKAQAETALRGAKKQQKKTAEMASRAILRASEYSSSTPAEQARAIQYAMADSGSDDDLQVFRDKRNILRQRVEQLKAQRGEGFREMTYSSFQQLIYDDYSSHNSLMVDAMNNEFMGLYNAEGKLLRAPTNRDLAKYRAFHNSKLSEHKSTIQDKLVYVVDDTDPIIKAEKDKYKQLTKQREADYQAHKQALMKLRASMNQQLREVRAELQAEVDKEQKAREEDAIKHLEAMEAREDELRARLDAERKQEIDGLQVAHELDLAQRASAVNDDDDDFGSYSYTDSDSDTFAPLPTEGGAEEELSKGKTGEDDGENVSLQVKETTGAVIDPTGSSGVGAGADPNTLSASQAPPPLPQQPAPQQQAQRLSNLMNIARLIQARRDAQRLRQQQITANLQRYRTAQDITLAQIRQAHDDFINNVGVQQGIETQVAPAVDVGVAQNTTYEGDKKESEAVLQSEGDKKEDADYDMKTDAKADVSKFGYGKQVSKFAKQQGRDFTYTMSLIAKSKNAPSQDAKQRKAQKDLMLAEWGDTIGIKKAKGNSYEECLEIYTIVFLAEDLYRMERNYKKAMIKYLPLLKNLSRQMEGNTQLGIITATQNPMTMTQADQLLRQVQRQGSRTRATIRTTMGAPPAPPTASPTASPPTSASAPTMGRDDSNMSGFGTAEEQETKGEGRRRLTGMNVEAMTYSNRDDFHSSNRGTDAGQAYIRGGAYNQMVGGGAVRQPNRPSGVQGVRQIVAQLPKPPKKMAKRDGRPKMNVADSQFRMRKSRINPNLLFVNLDKQNPNLTQDLPMFKTRTTEKTFRRLKF